MPETKATLDSMADEMYELYKVIAAARSRQTGGPDDLSETEFLTLDLLTKEEPLTIGEVQRRVGVVPAQMSRIVRALEQQGGKGYIECKINPMDRRRIDLFITDIGHKAHDTYRAARLRTMYRVLEALDSRDRIEFMRMMNVIRLATTEKKKKY